MNSGRTILMGDWISPAPGGVVINVKVKPRASADRAGPPEQDFLPVRLTAPPVDSKANTALIALIAKKLRVPKSAVTIVSGHKSRSKRVSISGASIEEARRALEGQ